MLLSQYLQYLSNLDINLFLKVYNHPVFNITMKLETIDSNTVTIYKTNNNILYSDAQQGIDFCVKRIYVYYAIYYDTISASTTVLYSCLSNYLIFKNTEVKHKTI